MKPSESHRRDAEAIRTFRDLYISVSDSVSSAWWHADITRRVDPRDVWLNGDVDRTEWDQRCRATSDAAGRATDAYGRFGVVLQTRIWMRKVFDATPLTIWVETLYGGGGIHLKPWDLISMLDTAIGKASQKAEDAKRSEKGIKGVIASILRWPNEIRESAGEDHKIQGALGYGIGVGGQIGILVIAGIAVWISTLGITAVINYFAK